MNYTNDVQYPIYKLPKRLVFTDEPNLPRKTVGVNKARNLRLASLQKLIKRYKSWGLSLIPVERKGKKPLVRWQQYQSRKPDIYEREYSFAVDIQKYLLD